MGIRRLGRFSSPHDLGYGRRDDIQSEAWIGLDWLGKGISPDGIGVSIHHEHCPNFSVKQGGI